MKTQPDPELVLTLEEIAELLRVSVKTVRRMREDGRLPKPIDLGGNVLRWFRPKIINWIGHGCQPRPLEALFPVPPDLQDAPDEAAKPKAPAKKRKAKAKKRGT